jgi:uncharacterized DUF497 family protein
MEKQLIMTAHAWIRSRDRDIAIEWIEATVRHPDWTSPDPGDDSIERRYRAIPEFGGRILRVVCIETDFSIRVISVLFDRNARPPS